MPKVVVTKAEWIRKGLDYFSAGGADSLAVEKMARELGCSKSSFYWYFNGREQFVDVIVAEWAARATEDVMRQASEGQGADERIKLLLGTMFSTVKGKDFLFYLRRLGGRVPRYRHAVEELENRRMAFMASLLEEKGFSPAISGQMAAVIYHFYLGWHERHKDREGHSGSPDPGPWVDLIWSNVIERNRTEG